MKKRVKNIQTIWSIFLVLCLFSSTPLFHAILLTTATQQHAMLSYTIRFSQPQLTEVTIDDKTFTQIEIKDCLSQNDPGHPALPLRPIQILIPAGKTPTEITVSYPTYTDLSSDIEKKPIIPQQDLITTNTPETDEPLMMNTKVYNSTTPIFENLYEQKEIGYCRGYQILSLILHPIQYIPGTNQLYYFPQLDITIDLAEDEQDQTHTLLRNSQEDTKIIQNLVINPDIIQSYQTEPEYTFLTVPSGLCNPEDTYEYVIITNDALNDTTGETYNWSDLLTHRHTLNGYNTTKITTETIDQWPTYWNETALFNDTAAHIREFIKDAYQNWETQYVVLGGDWDTDTPANQIVPARIFTEYTSFENSDDYYTMPCDLYYSHLDGDWRDIVHNCWGGGRNSGVNDPYGEVYIGRMTVCTAEQLSNFIQKIIWYDLFVDTVFVNKTVFLGGNLGFQSTSAEYMEEVRNGTDPNFYQCIGFKEWNTDNPDTTFNISTRKYYDWGASIPSDYITVINNNNACLINHIGHGSPTTALDMSNAQLNSLANTKYFFAHSQQCLAGRFTEGDTTEKTLTCMNANNGAFGLIWNTGYGWASSVNTNGPNQFLQRKFWHYLFNTSMEHWQIGAAHAYAQDEMSAYVDIPGWHYAWCYNWYSSHFFGDPAQTLKSIVPEIVPCSLSNETPTNGTTNLSVGDHIIGISVSDYEGDLMNITFLTNASGSWEDIGFNSSQYNGTYAQDYDFLNYNTSYWWSVHVHDIAGNSGWTNETYSLRTRPLHSATPPENFIAVTYNKTQINLTWSLGTNATQTYIERATTQLWNRGTGLLVYNDSGEYYDDHDLVTGVTYYYQAWCWDEEDMVWSIENASTSNITINCVPRFSNESPQNYSVNESRNPVLSIMVSDLDGDSVNVSMWTNSSGQWSSMGYNISLINNNYHQNTTLFNNYSTTYWWSVNCTDGENWTNATYVFMTRANLPPLLSNETPSNESTNVARSTSSLTITIIDSDDDHINWSIWTNPDIGNNSMSNDTSGNKTCTITGLQYDTTYYCFVNVTDNGSGQWTNYSWWFTTEEEPSIPSGGSYTPPPPSPPPNTPPNNPVTPLGTQTGYLYVNYTYSANTTDPENQMIQYLFDWGDNTTSNWTNAVESGESVSLSHYWSVEGSYLVRVKAKDVDGAVSDWSDVCMVLIQHVPAAPKVEPKLVIHIPDNVFAQQVIVFTVSIDDYEESLGNLSFVWEFGDGGIGNEMQSLHWYAEPGVYQATVTIYDGDDQLGLTTHTVVVSPNDSLVPIRESDERVLAFSWPILVLCGVCGVLICVLLLFKKRKTV
ncbi:MAG: C25 family cysteine peptidase [Methanobacteriota archaeon]